MKITRKLRREHRRSDALATRAENGGVKAKERTRRDARMIEKIKGDGPRVYLGDVTGDGLDLHLFSFPNSR